MCVRGRASPCIGIVCCDHITFVRSRLLRWGLPQPLIVEMLYIPLPLGDGLAPLFQSRWCGTKLEGWSTRCKVRSPRYSRIKTAARNLHKDSIFKILTDYFGGYQLNIFFCLARARCLALTSWFGTAFVSDYASPISLTICSYFKRQ